MLVKQLQKPPASKKAFDGSWNNAYRLVPKNDTTDTHQVYWAESKSDTPAQMKEQHPGIHLMNLAEQHRGHAKHETTPTDAWGVILRRGL